MKSEHRELWPLYLLYAWAAANAIWSITLAIREIGPQ